MKRSALALTALLLACTPPSADDDAPTSAQPAEQTPAPLKPRAPKPAQQPAPTKKSKSTLQAGSYYQYVDESGHVQFAASLEGVPERQRSTAAPVAAPSAPKPAASERRESAASIQRTTNAEVVLYTTRSCPYCKRAIAYLEQIGQDFVNKEVDRDEEAREEYLRLTNGHAGVPVIVVGDRWMQGWSQSQLAQMLADSR